MKYPPNWKGRCVTNLPRKWINDAGKWDIIWGITTSRACGGAGSRSSDKIVKLVAMPWHPHELVFNRAPISRCLQSVDMSRYKQMRWRTLAVLNVGQKLEWRWSWLQRHNASIHRLIILCRVCLDAIAFWSGIGDNGASERHECYTRTWTIGSWSTMEHDEKSLA